MDLRLSNVVFLRLSAGNPAWLTKLRWPRPILAMMEEHRHLVEEENRSERVVTEFGSRFTTVEWANLQTWLGRAPGRESTNLPQLLHNRADVHAFTHLVEVRRHRHDQEIRILKALDENESRLVELALRCYANRLVQLIVANASADLATSAERLLGDKAALSAKERRRLARTLWAQLARSTHKSCPLAFAADTGVLLAEGRESTDVQVGAEPYVSMRPNQDLCNTLIAVFRPTEAYLVSAKRAVRLNVGARLDGQRLQMWRTSREGNVVRESLATIRLPSTALSAIERAGQDRNTVAGSDLLIRSESEVLQRLLDNGALVRDDLVTPIHTDPWAVVSQALADVGDDHSEAARQYTQAERHARAFLLPRPLSDSAASILHRALTTFRKLRDEVLGPDKLPSSSVSMDTYRSVSGDISRDDLDVVAAAVSQHFVLAGWAYPHTPTYRRRQAFIGHFRRRYGDDAPVHLETMLIADWSEVERALSFLLDPGHSPVHSNNDLVWPQPPPDAADPYGQFYAALQEAAASNSAVCEIRPVVRKPTILERCQRVMDAICRIERNDSGRLRVFVESATVTGRLVARHLNVVQHIDSSAAAAVDRYLDADAEMLGAGDDPESTTVLVVATHAVPRLQNLSHVLWRGGPVLAISEPAPKATNANVIRFDELCVRFDSGRQGFVVTRGAHGPPLRFAWPSPLSPSFNRRLHLLRFLVLAAEPVVTAPRWLGHEAERGGHLPRINVGPLVLSPQRWSYPLTRFDSCLGASGVGRYLAVAATRHELGLPDEAFVYTAHDTRPAFIDFNSPFGTDVFLRLLRKGTRDRASTVLVEERFPQPGYEVINSPARSGSMIFRCMTDHPPPQRHAHAD